MKAKKKKRQDDFQKVKLKVGKKKPKSDNATNTNFRSKGINLTEQLKRDTSGPTTHRQLGINVRSSSVFHMSANSPAFYRILKCVFFNALSSYFTRTSCLSSTITTPM